MVNSHEGTKPSTTWTRPSGHPSAARGSTTSKTLMLGHCRQYGDPRLLEVTEERNGPSGLRDGDDDDCNYTGVFPSSLMYKTYCQFLPFFPLFLLVFSTVPARILFATAKTQPWFADCNAVFRLMIQYADMCEQVAKLSEIAQKLWYLWAANFLRGGVPQISNAIL